MPVAACRVELVDEDLFYWHVALKGPCTSPYQNGVFRFSFKYPVDYPASEPHVRCLTPIFHCNIDQNGTVCWRGGVVGADETGGGADPVSRTSNMRALELVQILLSLLSLPVPEDAL